MGVGDGVGGAGGGFTLPALASFSMPHSLLPRAILKKPLSPHSSFHEFLIFHYFWPFSSPHPTMVTACPPFITPEVWR